MSLTPADETTAVSDPIGSGRSEDAGPSSNRADNQTLAIALSTALSVLAVIIIAGSIFICCRYRQGRLPFTKRGATPIDDEEIESWKRKDDMETSFDDKPPTMHKKHASTTSLRKPPSVVVYHNAHHEWPPMENTSPRSAISNCNGSKKSVEIPQTPVLARAPNARPGLTDECVQGDDAFLPSPKRKPSRLSKYPPNASTTTRGHSRTLSTRSSFSFGGSIRDQWYGQGYATDTEFSPRSSNDNLNFQRTATSSELDRSRGHHRVYSSSDIPPRLSLDEVYYGGLSPRPIVHSSEIGRAIG
ncbi:hypothetical protein F5X68DRAFT_191795 [Plectosphaerella plurivora]|uniref:Uncharacterized protein n=1 Tax=Plectosphaerella plurivora TaxID=936078 RepID=A0A9P8V8S9_9PEZI|nr:hypothetical protein F5X68DRAFT_191795 [Plectosphaerella plurivora]